MVPGLLYQQSRSGDINNEKSFLSNGDPVLSDSVLNQISIHILQLNELVQSKTDSTQFRHEIEIINESLCIIKQNIDKTNIAYKILKNKNKQDLVEFSTEIQVIDNKLNSVDSECDSLKRSLIAISANLSTINSTILDMRSQTNSMFSNVDEKYSKQKLYWIVIISITLVITVVLFILLKRNVVINVNRNSDKIDKTTEKLENKILQLNTQLIHIHEQNLDAASIQTQQSQEIDHSLPIKLCEEIHRMRKRLKTMEESQGTKVLTNRIENLEDKLNTMGYEIVDLMGRNFDEGMDLNKAQFIPDDTLNDGERVITSVIKPQINFNGVIIQAADVKISQGD